jgi:imidazole glycerol-phosphate synthase subunit HisH
MRVVIIDYQAGNLTSVKAALGRLGCQAEITADPAVVARADRVVFPGVGSAAACMANLRQAGLDRALRDTVAAGKPLLGICIGMQLLFERSEEDGGVDCLGLLPGAVRRFQLADPALKVPHMGWNTVDFAVDPLADCVPPGSHFYFVHSYYCDPAPGVAVIATTDHGIRFCAGVRRDNLAAVQFHPEKSGKVGLRFLENFLK